MTSINNRRNLYGNFNNVKKNSSTKQHNDYHGLDMKIIFSKKRYTPRSDNMRLLKQKFYFKYGNGFKKKNQTKFKFRVVRHNKIISRPLVKYYTGSKSNRRKYRNTKCNMANRYNMKNIKKLIN